VAVAITKEVADAVTMGAVVMAAVMAAVVSSVGSVGCGGVGSGIGDEGDHDNDGAVSAERLVW
jgi:hypothetical protein